MWEDYFDIEPAYATGDAYEDYVPNLIAHAVAVDNAGNAVVSWSADYLAIVYDEINDRYNDEIVASFHYLTKYSPSGSKLWRVYTDDPLTDLALDSNANINATSGPPFTDSRAALLKYTPSGSRTWTRSQPVYSSGVTVSSTNTVYIVRVDGAVAKYSANGTQLWLKTGQLDGYNWAGFYGSGEPYKITTGLADELYITATYRRSSSEGCDAGFTRDYYTMRIYKLNGTGVRQWFRNVADGTYTEGQDCSGKLYFALSGLGVASDTKGNVYIAGYQDGYSSNSFVPDQDGFVAKYSRTGALAWKKAS